jgi:hypothetical protein
MELHLAEALGSILDRLREHLFRVGLRHVVAVEPRKPARCGRLQRLHPFEGGSTCEEVRLRHSRSVEMREIGRRLRTKMKVKVEDPRPPLVRGCALPAERRNDGGGDRFEEFTAVDHESSFAWRSPIRDVVVDL